MGSVVPGGSFPPHPVRKLCTSQRKPVWVIRREIALDHVGTSVCRGQPTAFRALFQRPDRTRLPTRPVDWSAAHRQCRPDDDRGSRRSRVQTVDGPDHRCSPRQTIDTWNAIAESERTEHARRYLVGFHKKRASSAPRVLDPTPAVSKIGTSVKSIDALVVISAFVAPWPDAIEHQRFAADPGNELDVVCGHVCTRRARSSNLRVPQVARGAPYT